MYLVQILNIYFLLLGCLQVLPIILGKTSSSMGFILSSHQNSDSRAFSQILHEGIMKAVTQDDETKNIYLIAITLCIERS